MALRLVPTTEGTVIDVNRPIVLIGRDADCDVCIESRKVSRRHCCLVQLEGTVLVRDLGSTNGVVINGRRVEGETRLMPDDEVAIGDWTYRVEQADGTRPVSLPRSMDTGPPTVRTDG